MLGAPEPRRRGWARRRRDERGIVGTNLVLVIAFALFAVIVLSRTAISAAAINHSVKLIITPAVTGINQNLKSVPLLNTTNSVAKQIDTAAAHLSSEAGQVVSSTQSIDGKASSIQSSVLSINSSVHHISATVNSIASSVGTINSSVTGPIASDVSSVGADVSSINSTVHGIGGTFVALAPVVSDIQSGQDTAGGVVAINHRADTVIGLVNSIHADTSTIRATVVNILSNARDIRNNILVRTTL